MPRSRRPHPRPRGAQSASKDSPGLKWQGVTALILGAILLACGVVLFVSAHWDQLSPGARFTLVIAMVAVFHTAGALARPGFHGVATALHAVGTVATGAAIALVGQIFNVQEHWPAAVLLWALAALAGWLLLRDQAQQTLALLLVPAWIFCELGFRMSGHIGEDVYLGRLYFMWAVLYITFFVGSKRMAVQGILFAVSVIGVVYGAVMMLSCWVSFSADQSFIPFGTRVWAWVAIAAIPLVVAAFHGHKGLAPITAAIAFCLALPWCCRTWTESHKYGWRYQATYVRTPIPIYWPTCSWPPSQSCFAGGACASSRARSSISALLAFAAAVVWFYSSDIMSKFNRSLGLIGLGILFLAGGWALEKMRRRILARMAPSKSPASAGAAADVTPRNVTPENQTGGAQ